MGIAVSVVAPPLDAAAITVARAEEASAAEWDRFVTSRPAGTGYHLWGWRVVFEQGLGHRCHYLLARRDNAVCGVLPLVEVRSALFGHALSSLPYVNYGGVLADDAATAAALAEAAAELARQGSARFVLYRHRQRVLAALPVRAHKVTMLLPLADSSKAMWEGLDRKVRNQVRKGEKSNLTVVSGGPDLLDDFYAVFARNMRDLGTPVYGRALFAAILKAFPGSAQLHVVQLGDVVIAGALSYKYGDVIEVPSASSLREHRSLCPNHIMYWRIMEQAIAAKLRVFDFGRSTPGDGTFNFKEQWGARAEPLHWEYQLLGGNTLPNDDRHNAKFRTTIAIWKRLPIGMATRIGPVISRGIP